MGCNAALCWTNEEKDEEKDEKRDVMGPYGVVSTAMLAPCTVASKGDQANEDRRCELLVLEQPISEVFAVYKHHHSEPILVHLIKSKTFLFRYCYSV